MGDERTSLEAHAYACWMHGTLMIEAEEWKVPYSYSLLSPIPCPSFPPHLVLWKAAVQQYMEAQAIYENLAKALLAVRCLQPCCPALLPATTYTALHCHHSHNTTLPICHLLQLAPVHSADLLAMSLISCPRIHLILSLPCSCAVICPYPHLCISSSTPP